MLYIDQLRALLSILPMALWVRLQIIAQDFRGVDAGFQYLMVFFVGFMVPLLAFFSEKALAFLLVVIGFFIALRYFMRPAYRSGLKQDLSGFSSRIFLSFIIVVCLGIIHTLFKVDFEGESPLLSMRAVILVPFLISWCYFYQQKNEPFSKALSAAFLIGSTVYLIILGLDIAKNYLIWFFNDSRWKDPYNIAFLTSRVLGQNRSLIIISALTFLVPFHQKRLGFSQFYFHFMIITLFVFSVINVGGYGTMKHYIYHVGNESVQVGLILSWLVFMAATIAPRVMIHLVFLSMISFLGAAPWFFQTLFTAIEKTGISVGVSLQVRLEIWRDVGQQITSSWQTMIWGNGLASSAYLENLNVYHIAYKKAVAHPHPHNALLQLWLDLGGVSVLLVCIMLVLLWRWCLAVKQEVIPSVLGTISMAYLLWMVTFSIWHVWWMAVLAFIILHLSLVPKQSEPQ